MEFIEQAPCAGLRQTGEQAPEGLVVQALVAVEGDDELPLNVERE